MERRVRRCSSVAIGGPIAVRVTQTAPNTVAVYTEDIADFGISGTQKQARLFTDVRGRFVTITVRGLTGRAVSSQSASRALLM
jgi:hypothetical protein